MLISVTEQDYKSIIHPVVQAINRILNYQCRCTINNGTILICSLMGEILWRYKPEIDVLNKSKFGPFEFELDIPTQYLRN